MATKLWTFRQIVGDLFTAPREYALAHCVAADMRMGAGIAILFRYVAIFALLLKPENV